MKKLFSFIYLFFDTCDGQEMPIGTPLRWSYEMTSLLVYIPQSKISDL